MANRKGKYIGLCGQAPSDHADFCEFLVEAGIGSMALSPDAVMATLVRVAKKEAELGIKPKSN